MINETMNDEKTIVNGGRNMMLAKRYRIIRRLGQGGMGSVWLAEDTQLDNRKVAVKMLPTILVQDERAYQQLKGEALVSLKLIHPNIVTLRAFEENKGAPFLVMDYVEGQTLSDYLARKGKLSESETVRLLKPIAAALDYAHKEKVVHRDVKPSNIIIRKDGHPFILDFGIAREIQESMTRVTGRTISGTLLYMSPEQLRGAAPAPAQDVYSFAAMVYECLKGEPPFTRGEIAYQILNEKPVPLVGGTQLNSMVMAGLAKDSADRPKGCAEVLGEKNSLADNVYKNYDSILLKRILLGIGVALSVCLISLLLWIHTHNKKKNTEQFFLCYANECYDEAAELIDKIDIRNAKVQFFVGEMYYYGFGVEEDRNIAVKWYKKAADQGYVVSQWQLGFCYYTGSGVTKSIKEAIIWFRKAADQGYANAQCALGNLYDVGRGVVRDSCEAVKWYRKAAEQGFADAQLNLGIMYYEGEGVIKNYQEASTWYHKAAVQGNMLAQYNLGTMYMDGIGVVQDDREAVKWFHRAAKQGSARAQCQLGYMYNTGRGITQDAYEAVKWYRKSAEQGYAKAQCALGFMYLKGTGVVKDDCEATNWYRKAANQGYAYGQLCLGMSYETGSGVTKDEHEAVRWYRKAAKQGEKYAQEKLKENGFEW